VTTDWQFQEHIGRNSAITAVSAITSVTTGPTAPTVARSDGQVGRVQAWRPRTSISSCAAISTSPPIASASSLSKDSQRPPAVESNKPVDAQIGQAAHAPIETAPARFARGAVFTISPIELMGLGNCADHAWPEERAGHAHANAIRPPAARQPASTMSTRVRTGRAVHGERSRQDADIEWRRRAIGARAGRFCHQRPASHGKNVALNDDTRTFAKLQALDTQEHVHFLELIEFGPIGLAIHRQVQHLAGREPQLVLADDLVVQGQVVGQAGQVAWGRAPRREDIFLAAIVHALRKALTRLNGAIEDLTSHSPSRLVVRSEQLPRGIQTVDRHMVDAFRPAGYGRRPR